MGSFDFSMYDYDEPMQTTKPKSPPPQSINLPKSTGTFDFSAYDYEPPETEQDFIAQQEEESNLKSGLRTAAQIPLGIASTTTPGLLAGLWEILASGDVYDPEEIEHLKKISEREGVPFNEEAYYQAAEKALSAIPTVSNIASAIEHYTGAPLEPKTRLQKGLRFGTEASRLAPKPGTFRGMNTSLPRPVLGAGVEATKELLQETGLPEPLSELASFAVLKHPPAGAPSIQIGKKTKPSGLPERRFENIRTPTEVPAKKYEQITQKVENDFRNISDKIIQESPIGETANNLKNDHTFKQQSRELINQAQEIADTIPDRISSRSLKTEIADMGKTKTKGFAANEYDKTYNKFLKEAIDEIPEGHVTAGQLVEQYRKNNAALSEYFEPGSSKALNRAKKDALLDQNRAISNAMEKFYPESELVPIFKEGNAQWTKIMDVEAIDDFIGKIFNGEKITHKKIHDFFDKPGYDRIFKRALGEKGYKEFKQLLTDMLTSETPYKMLKIAKARGYDELFKTGMSYLIHPNLAMAKVGYNTLKESYKGLMNFIIDKPKIGFKFKAAVEDLKSGNFKAAEGKFRELKGEMPAVEGEIQTPKAKTEMKPKGETINVTPERMTKSQPAFNRSDSSLVKSEPYNIKSPKETPSEGLASRHLLSNTSKTPPPSGNERIRQNLPLQLQGSSIIGSIDTSNRMVTQASNNVQEIINKAKINEPKLKNILKDISNENSGIEIKGVRIKDVEKTKNKIEQGRSANTITDYLGGRLTFDNNSALETIENSLKGKKIIHEDDFLHNPDLRSGYRGMHYQIDMGNGFSAEIQVQPKEISEVFPKAHELYDKWKRVDFSKLSSAEEQLYKADKAEMRKIFDNAWDKYEKRNTAKIESPIPKETPKPPVETKPNQKRFSKEDEKALFGKVAEKKVKEKPAVKPAEKLKEYKPSEGYLLSEELDKINSLQNKLVNKIDLLKDQKNTNISEIENLRSEVKKSVIEKERIEKAIRYIDKPKIKGTGLKEEISHSKETIRYLKNKLKNSERDIRGSGRSEYDKLRKIIDDIEIDLKNEEKNLSRLLEK